MRALRTHHTDEAGFVRRVDEVQRPEGYRIVGAFEGERCVAVAGFRVIHNLAWGDTLYVDDLSTLPEARGRGHGRALLEWCKEEGAAAGLRGVPSRLGRGPGARGRASALLQHRPAHHELPLRRAPRMIDRELEALVAVSSPSGDREGAEECVALATAFLPSEAEVERVPCSTPDHADDMVGRLRGSRHAPAAPPRAPGHRRAPRLAPAARARRRPPHRLGRRGHEGRRGAALALMRQLAERPELYAEVAVLLVNDEEWRTAPFIHAERFAGFDACLCFEGGERTAEGDEAVIVKRKAAATLRVDAYGRSVAFRLGAGARPERAAGAHGDRPARRAAHDDPAGPDRLTAVPTILRSGDAFNVVPADGELLCDLRADRLDAFDPVFAALPSEHDEVRLESTLVRAWPGLDSRAATADVLADASERLGRPIVGSERGGASDASHIATGGIACTIDGLGPLGGGAHTPDEWVSAESLHARADVALAIAEALLGAVKGSARVDPQADPLKPPAPPPGGPQAPPAVRGAT